MLKVTFAPGTGWDGTEMHKVMHFYGSDYELHHYNTITAWVFGNKRTVPVHYFFIVSLEGMIDMLI